MLRQYLSQQRVITGYHLYSTCNLVAVSYKVLTGTCKSVGLVMYLSIPACRQTLRYSGSALADMAIIKRLVHSGLLGRSPFSTYPDRPEGDRDTFE